MNEKILFIKKINKFIFNKNLLNIKKLYILTISGGQDSICLLFFFYIIKKQFQIKIYIFNCNHLWQYDNFRQSVQLRQLCFLFQLKFFQIISNNFLFTEQEARIWRLKNFYRYGFFFNGNLLVTGHSATDRIETFFLNLIRGSSLSGLQSFNEKKKLFLKNTIFTKNNFSCFKKKKTFFLKKKKDSFKNDKKVLNKSFQLEKIHIQNYYLLRPFFLVNRIELKSFLNFLQLPIFPDQTNFNFIYKRNRIRQQIFPLLKKLFNNQIDLSFVKLITLISKIQEELLSDLRPLYNRIVLKQKYLYCINIDFLKKLSDEKQKRIFFIFFYKELNYGITFEFLKNFSNLITQLKKQKYLSFKFLLVPKIGFMGIYKNHLYIIKK